ncbi:MAG: MGMT family protein [Armatimonadota bacterium]|nr:MGMT family protein [Armatimonadota bacterium]
MSALFATIYAIVKRVPRGRIVSYGGVARLAGLRGGARTVGWALASTPRGEKVPWWRVLRGDGTVAPRPFADEQRRRLRAEGVRFDRRGVVDLRRYGWPSAESAGRRTSRRPPTQVRNAAAPHTPADTSTVT